MMLPPGHFLIGGTISSIFAVLGTLLNLLALAILVERSLRRNATTVLVIKLS